MAENEDTYKLLLQVVGEADAKKLREEIKQTEKEIQKLNADMAGAPFDQFASAAKGAADQLAQLKSRLKEVEAGLDKGAGGTKNFGRAALEGSRAIEDLQYGIGGVVNNIPGLVQAFGGTNGIIAIVSLAAVGVAQLVKHWDELMAALGSPKVKTAAEEMKELEAATRRTADEEERYQKLKQNKENQEAQRGLTTAQKQAGAEINQAIKDAPKTDMEQAVKVLYGNEIKGGIPKEVRDARDQTQKEYEAAQAAPPGTTVLSLDQYQKYAEDARKEYERHEQEQVDKKLSGMGMTDEKGHSSQFNSFVSDLQSRPDLQPGQAAMNKLQEATKTPEEKRMDKLKGDLQKTWDKFQQDVQEKLKKQFEKDVDEAYKAMEHGTLKKKVSQYTPAEKEAARRYDENLSKEMERANAFDPKEQQKNIKAGQDQAAKEKSAKDAETARQQSETNARRAESDIRTFHPGLDGALQGKLAQRQMQGQDAKSAVSDLTTELSKWLQETKGVGALDAMKMARDHVEGAQQALNQGVMGAMNEQPEQQEHRQSQVVGISDFANQIQSSVGKDDTPQKQLGVLENIYKVLANNGGVNNVPKFQ